jgi:hypothetical protein
MNKVEDLDFPFCRDVNHEYEKLTKVGQGTFGCVYGCYSPFAEVGDKLRDFHFLSNGAPRPYILILKHTMIDELF